MRRAHTLVCPNGYVNVGGRCVKKEFTKQSADGRFELDAVWLDSTVYSEWNAQQFVGNPATARIPRVIIPRGNYSDNDEENTGTDPGIGGLVTPDEPEDNGNG